jgi:hypothetical protein
MRSGRQYGGVWPAIGAELSQVNLVAGFMAACRGDLVSGVHVRTCRSLAEWLCVAAHPLPVQRGDAGETGERVRNKHALKTMNADAHIRQPHRAMPEQVHGCLLDAAALGLVE